MKSIHYFLKKLQRYSGKILIFNVLGMALISMLEGIGIFLLLPMLSIIGIVGIKLGATPISGLFHFLQSVPASLALPLVLGIFLFLVLSQILFQRSLTVRNVTIVQGFIHQLRIETYQLLLQAKWEFFLTQRKSDLVNGLTTEMGRITNGISQTLQLLTAVVFMLIQVGLAFWLSPSLTAVILVLGLMLSLFSRKYIAKSKRLGSKTSELQKSYLSGITDQLNGMKDIKSNVLEKSRMAWLRSMTAKMLGEQIEYVELKTASQLFYKIASTVLIVVFIYFSVEMFHAQPEQLLLIIAIFSRLWPKISAIQANLQQIAATIPAFKALIDLQKECKEAREPQSGVNQDDRLHIRKGLECRGLFFRYNREKETCVLQDINIEIPANRMTAIVGRSGAGKSTLIDIVMGMMHPEKGWVHIDGMPLTNDKLSAFRRSIGYVPQDPFLFHGTIRDNMQMVKPEASDGEIWDALRFSAADDFVSELPKGLDTTIGDRGVRLSGGERQRLILARAILRRPSILVLDEATSAMDSETEAKIQQALDRLHGTMTIIVVAHRLSTIRNADQIIVLDQGRILQKGEFNQLAVENEGLFSSLLENQITGLQASSATHAL